jgi:acyl transferase domain-containing protein
MTQPGSDDRRKLLEQALRQVREMRARMEATERAQREPIAIVGAGVRMPHDAHSPDDFWRMLSEGGDAVAPLFHSVDGQRPPANGNADGAAALLDGVDGFDAGFFGISGPEASHLDPQQRLVLETAWEALEDAGLPSRTLTEHPTGVFVGLYGNDFLTLQIANPDEINVYTAPGGAHSVVANRLSHLLDLRGPSLAVDTACSSALVATHLAVRALRAGDCDYAFVGGVNAILSPLSTMITEKVLPISPSGRCRTFDADADGIVRAEACGVVLLQRLSDAQASGRRVRGVIRGSAVNHGGRSNGLTAPNPRGQVELMQRALRDAGADPGDVAYIEMHGTGTPLGDPIEAEAIREVYGGGGQPCALGSVKTNLGHAEGAAGIVGLVKTMLVLEHGQVPPLLHLERMNPEIDLNGTSLSVPTELTPLPEREGRRLAAVSSFGFSGANAHVVLEEPPPVEEDAAPRAEPPKLLLPLSARSDGALRELAGAYAEQLRGADAGAAADVCAAAALGRTHHPYRLCPSAGDAGELLRQLEVARSAQVHPAVPAERPVAFVFSGQGSQWAEMGRELLEREPVVREEVERCDAAIKALAGWSVIEQLTLPEPQTRLPETEVAQLSIAALQLGLAALWRSWGIEPYAVVGHSMGEIVAACAAGALDRSQALELLMRRSRITERGAHGGAMASIALTREEVEPLVQAAGGRVSVGAVNGPRSTVVSGEPDAVDRVVAAAGERGAAARRLRVEYGFHSPLLDGADEELAAAVPHIQGGACDVAIYSTTTGGRLDPERLDAAHWGRNLREPVLFAAAVEEAANDGATVFIEVGPHPVLLRDCGETLEALGTQYVSAGSLRRHEPVATSLYRSVADLYRAGLEIRWDALMPAPRRHVPLPTYPWQRSRHWLEAPGGIPMGATASAAAVAAPTTGSDGAAEQANGSDGSGAEATDGNGHAAPDAEQLTLYVRERIAGALEVDDVEKVPGDVELEALALDSLTIVELKNQVERELGIRVPLAALLDAKTPTDLGHAVAEALGGSRGVAAV